MAKIKVTDMKGVEIKLDTKIRKHSLIYDDTSPFKEKFVSYIGTMHEGGKMMVWAGGGGAHHPKACIVVSEDRGGTNDKEI